MKKVLMLNGSPNEKGCTFTALTEIANTLAEEGISSEIIHIAKQPVSGCRACRFCMQQEEPRCAVQSDMVNDVLAMLDDCDGLILGSPVHYASASGHITSFCDRLFYSGARKLAFKPGAAIVSARRAGTTAALDQLNKYFSINNMLQVGSQYWTMVHGSAPEDVLQDGEGLQTMRALARNMAWAIKCLNAGKQAGIMPPALEAKIRTNFIR